MSVFDYLDEEGNVKETTVLPENRTSPGKNVFDMPIEAKQEEKSIPWWKSVPADVLKGFLESALRVGRVMGPTQEFKPERQIQKEFTEKLDEFIPSQETFLGKAIRRGEQIAGPALVFPGGATLGTGIRSMAAGAGGQFAEHLGLPEWVQNIAEIAPFIAPNLSKQIPLQAEQQELGKFARGRGLQEEDLALTLGQRGAVRDIAEGVSPKGGKTVDAFQNTREALGRVWNTLEATPEATKALTGHQTGNFLNELSTKLARLPSETRNRVMQDYNELVSSNMTGKDLINFWQDLNYYISSGERSLGTLKEPIMNAMNKISPKLGNDFRLTNQLYSNFAKQSERMGPDIADRLVSLGESGIVLQAVTTGNFPLLQKILGPVGGRQLAREMVINPKFQNLGNRIIRSLNEGKGGVAKKALDQLILLTSKKNPEAAKHLSDEEIRKFLEESK